MDICKIEGFTRVLGAPRDWDQSDTKCNPLPICDRPDGWMVSQWKPDAKEIEALIKGDSIFLWVFGAAHPVVGLSVVNDAGVTAGEDEATTMAQELAHRNAEVQLLRLALERLQGTLGDQQRLCEIAISATGAQEL